MQKLVITICLALSGLIILDSLEFGHAVMMFLLAGVIPGTNFALPASVTLQLFALLIGFVLARLVSNAISSWFTSKNAARQPSKLS